MAKPWLESPVMAEGQRKAERCRMEVPAGGCCSHLCLPEVMPPASPFTSLSTPAKGSLSSTPSRGQEGRWVAREMGDLLRQQRVP